MTKEVRIQPEDDENVDFKNFNPDEMLTNKPASMYVNKYDYSIPPDEDFLTNNTLWPESNKLFGHGYEIISLSVSHDGRIIASGGKSQSEKHSKLFLWSSEKNNLIAKLDGHTLTIVQIEFSNDDEFILTVSRDRSLCLYRINDERSYSLVQTEKETHGRIIWSCSWSSDSKIFITGSRDKSIKVWKRNENFYSNEKIFIENFCKEFDDAVTSVNIVPDILYGNQDENYIIIIGFENGDIQIFCIDTKNLSIKHLTSVHKFLAHGSTVRRIKSYTKDKFIYFATCSDDFSTRIFEINLELLNTI